jgi:alkyl sulfatase BDS1-like metallo-beta-lactamase superfamily hydrolase
MEPRLARHDEAETFAGRFAKPETSTEERYDGMQRLSSFLMVLTFTAGVGMTAAQAQQAHFHPKGKPPSKFTTDLQQDRRAALPFDDERDFEEAKKGFIAAPSYRQIKAEAGHVAWDMGSYDFLLKGEDFASIHPSLQRQAVLNMAYGLYEVVPGAIYQVRGFDLANFTKAEDGCIRAGSAGSDGRWMIAS